jgi:small conductance mechanosensitive channel
MKGFLEKIANTKEGTWQNIAIAYGIKIILAIVILIVGFWLINKLVRLTDNFFKKRKVDNTVNSFFKNLISAALKILLTVFILNFIGVQTTSIVAILGAAGLAIGLALQGTLTNFAGGVMLLLFKPFKVGDNIEAQSKKGKVKEIQIFSTILTTEDNTQIVIPNSILSNGIIENHGREKISQKK